MISNFRQRAWYTLAMKYGFLNSSRIREAFHGIRSVVEPSPNHAKDHRAHLIRRLGVACIGAAMAVTAGLMSNIPHVTESVYSAGLGRFVNLGLSTVSGLVWFSLVEVVLFAFALWFLLPGLAGLYHVMRGRRRLSNALVCGALRSAATMGAVVSVFYVLWGFNYARPDLATRMGWGPMDQDSGGSPWSTLEEQELARLCSELVDMTNFCYIEATGTTDLGMPSMPRMPLAEMDAAIDDAFAGVSTELGLHPTFARPRGPAKPILSSQIMSALGIAGFYFPYTGEANFNRKAPHCQRPLTIAHEKAHQRGITGEDEANFLAFLACANSSDPYTRYSAYLFAQRQLMTELVMRDREIAVALLHRRLPGVQRDVDWLRAFWDGYRGVPRSVSLAMNNVYLKANQVEGGLHSYHRSAQLLVLYARHRGGTCLIRNKPASAV
jgi:hypothetical protein